MSAQSGVRSRKTLACTAEATAFQKAFGQELKRQVIDEGQPFVIAQADTPHEIFHAMDIPVISNQWWSAYISAKQLSGRYFDAEDCAAMGLLDIVAADTALKGAHALATQIQDNAPLSVAGSKLVLEALAAGSAGTRHAEISAIIERAMDSADYREGARAFLEKRKPAFTGR